MLGAVAAYVVARPFIRKGVQARRKLATEQRIEKHAAQAARKRARSAPKPTFTDDELAYMAAHTVSPYRRS